jgi:hypothetical protein
MRTCTRCGSTISIEKHHIIPRSEGGKTNDKNLRDLCKECHDFIHAEMDIRKALKFSNKRVKFLKKMLLSAGNSRFTRKRQNSLKYYLKRVKLLKHRLDVVRSLNAPSIIIIKGYQSYWKDVTTH